MQSISTINRHSNRFATDEAARFADTWADAAARFTSALWALLTIPSNSTDTLARLRLFGEWIDRVGWGRDCFASEQQFNLLTCVWFAHSDRRRPTIEEVHDVMDAHGWEAADLGIGQGDLRAELTAALEHESPAGLEAAAAVMVDCRNRRAMFHRLRLNQDRLLDFDHTVEDIIASTSSAVDAWRDRHG